MDPMWLLPLIPIALLVLYFIFIYNNLVSLKHNVSRSWSNIDVLLKQRHDELPKLVETCKQHMAYEQQTLERVMQARAEVSAARESSNVKALGEAESKMRLGLGNLFAVAEAYPELKASESFQHLHSRISSLESSISDRREFYNDSVNHFNIKIEQFPDIILAKQLGFSAASLLEFEATELKDVNMKQLFQ